MIQVSGHAKRWNEIPLLPPLSAFSSTLSSDLHGAGRHCLGSNHARVNTAFRGLDARLTGVEEAHVVKDILA